MSLAPGRLDLRLGTKTVDSGIQKGLEEDCWGLRGGKGGIWGVSRNSGRRYVRGESVATFRETLPV